MNWKIIAGIIGAIIIVSAGLFFVYTQQQTDTKPQIEDSPISEPEISQVPDPELPTSMEVDETSGIQKFDSNKEIIQFLQTYFI